MSDYLFEEDEKPSKSQLKREMIELQELGERLIHLAPKQLDKLALPPELLKAVLATRGMPKKDALRRQVQFIGRLMRDLDSETQLLLRRHFEGK